MAPAYLKNAGHAQKKPPTLQSCGLKLLHCWKSLKKNASAHQIQLSIQIQNRPTKTGHPSYKAGAVRNQKQRSRPSVDLLDVQVPHTHPAQHSTAVHSTAKRIPVESFQPEAKSGPRSDRPPGSASEEPWSRGVLLPRLKKERKREEVQLHYRTPPLFTARDLRSFKKHTGIFNHS